jgi:hypothetical protein
MVTSTSERATAVEPAIHSTRPRTSRISVASSFASIRAGSPTANTRFRPTTRSTTSRRSGARSGPTAFGIRGGSRSTGRPATSRLAMWARTPGRRSTSARARQATGVARTMGGAAAKAGTRMHRADRCALGRPHQSSPSPCSSTRTRVAATPAARSPAATSSAIHHCPGFSVATSMATTARRLFGTFSSRFPTRRATPTPART